MTTRLNNTNGIVFNDGSYNWTSMNNVYTLGGNYTTSGCSIGLYALCLRWSTPSYNGIIAGPGEIVSGSILYPANCLSTGDGQTGYWSGGGTYPGTWRLQGDLGHTNGNNTTRYLDTQISLFKRIL